MRKIDTFQPINKLDNDLQLIVLNHIIEHAKMHHLNVAETVTTAMNARLVDLDEYLPEYMQYSSAKRYFRVVLGYYSTEQILDVWNERCVNLGYWDEYVHDMFTEFNECMSDEDPSDIVYWTDHKDFYLDDKYFVIKQDDRFNIDRIYSYPAEGLFSVINYSKLAEWMADCPIIASKHIEEAGNIDIIDWFDL